MFETATTVMLRSVTCCHEGCGVVFGLNSQHEENLRKSHETFHCPNGHRQHFTNETDEEKLRKIVTELQDTINHKDSNLRDAYCRENQLGRRLSATRAVVTRVKNRIGHGVCPCCNRYFERLHRHMNSKHPDYVKEHTGA